MGDYVSVDPERLKQLADALQDAAALIPDKKSTISSNINGWSGSWNAGKVDALATWLDGQWRAMQDRADLAATAAHTPVVTTMDDPHAHWRGIPWDVTDQVLAQEGWQDATNINRDLTSDDPDAVARAQAELANALTAHADDPAWMQAFLQYGGADVINTANQSVLGDHLPISSEGQHQLAAYGTGLAAATTMAEDGTITVPADTFSVLYDGDNVMSTGVMMKFGPAGDHYGSQFLANTADAALDWRDSHPPRPGYSEPMTTSAGYVPGGYVQDDDDWWTQYGINVSYLTAGADEAADGIDLIREYDPVLAILDVTGDDQEASQLLLTGDQGDEHAHQLVQYDWATPPGTDDSAPVAEVILAATTDREGPEGQASAEAAANVFQAGYDLYHDDPRNDYTRELYPQLPPTLAQGLSAMASAYVVDLGQSTAQSDPSINGTTHNTAADAWMVQTNTAVINGYLGLFTTDPTAAGSFQGAVNAQIQAAAAATATWPDEATSALEQAGYLNGMTAIAISNQGYEDAQEADAAAAREKAYVDATVGIIRAVPGFGDAAKFFMGVGGSIYSATSSQLFPQDNVSTYTSEAQFIMNGHITDMRVYVAQGYADAGAYVPPDGASFVHGGVISPRTEQEQIDFDNWYATMPNDLSDLNDADDGFRDAAGVFAPNDDQFTPPEDR